VSEVVRLPIGERQAVSSKKPAAGTPRPWLKRDQKLTCAMVVARTTTSCGEKSSLSRAARASSSVTGVADSAAA
jgi:ribosomal protein L44E